MAALREIIARFGFQVNTGPLQRADKRIGSFKSNLQSLYFRAQTAGVAIMAMGSAITGFIESSRALGDSIDKTSKALGFSSEEFQRWSHAAALGGVNQQEFNTGVRTLAKRLSDADRGLATSVDSFKKLNIEFKNSDGSLRTTSDVLLDISDAFEGMTDPTRKAALAQELMGRAGTKMIPALMGGSDAVKKALSELDKYGFIQQDAIDAAVRFTDAQQRMKMGIESLKSRILTALEPALTSAAEKIGEAANRFGTWLNDTTAAKSALIAFGIVAAVALAPLLLAAGKLALLFAVAFIVVDDLLSLFSGGESVIGTFLDKITGSEDARLAIIKLGKAAKKALGGDFQGAADDAGEAWGELTGAIIESDIGDKIYDIGLDIETGIKDFVTGAINGIKGLANMFVQAGIDIANGIVDGFLQGLNAIGPKMIGSVENTFGNAVNAAKAKLKQRSPSKVFEGIGINTGLGYIRGIEKISDRIASVQASALAPTPGIVNASIRQVNNTNVTVPGSGSPAVVAGMVGSRVSSSNGAFLDNALEALAVTG